MGVYGLAVFSGAFLLFQVQPLLGKYILPWFGCTPAAWTACLLVFQLLLFGGYVYAHLSTRWLKPRIQVLLHLTLIAIALATLPITPSNLWKPNATADPTLRICELLMASIGLPFIVVSSTAPLMQTWFCLSNPGKSPFRLYALSNAGSLIALLSYPVVVENVFTRATQAMIWGIGLGVYGLSCLWAGHRVWTASPEFRKSTRPENTPEPPQASMVLWLLLPACATVLLAAVTNKICQDIAPIALLWVAPLFLYLVSFVLCFGSPRFYDRRWLGPALLICLLTASGMISGKISPSAPAQVLMFLAVLLVCCVVCHGELYRLRPDPRYLTRFYLAISAGGALGGVFVALIAPLIFNDYFELHCGLLLCGALFLAAWAREEGAGVRGLWQRVAWGGGAATLGVLAFVLWGAAHRNDEIRAYRTRNFYGVLSVYRHESKNPALSLVELVHGRVAHGLQFTDPGRSQQPTLYYTFGSGVGRAMGSLRGGRRRIGVVGLGAGTLAAYAHPGDLFRFYEINPEVAKVAGRFFTFLTNSPAQVQLVLGDARLSLENEPAQNFDLLALDAFNSDAIPTHLLTREAFAIYDRHLRPNGIIAVNVSNLSLDLEPVVLNVGREFGYTAEIIDEHELNEAEGVLPSTWVLLSRDPGLTNATTLAGAARPPALPLFKVPLWTDDFNGLLAVIRWSEMLGTKTRVESGGPMPTRTAVRESNLASAIDRFRSALAQDPKSSVALNNLACLLATAPDPALRNGQEAVRLAEQACALTQYTNTSVISTMAAAFAEAGRFEEAIAMAERACAMAEARHETTLLAGNQHMLGFYRKRQAYHSGGR